MRIIFHPEATLELNAAIDFYEGCTAGLGTRFLDEIQAALVSVKDNPEAYFRIMDEIRQFTLTGFPFKLLYHVGSHELIIIAVAHQRRRPGYWQSRR